MIDSITFLAFLSTNHFCVYVNVMLHETLFDVSIRNSITKKTFLSFKECFMETALLLFQSTSLRALNKLQMLRRLSVEMMGKN